MKLILLISFTACVIGVLNKVVHHGKTAINKENNEPNNFLNIEEIFKFYTTDSSNDHSSNDPHGIWTISVNLTQDTIAAMKIYHKNTFVDAYVFKYMLNKDSEIVPYVKDLYPDTDPEPGEDPVKLDRNSNDLIVENFVQSKNYITVTVKRHINTYDVDDVILKPSDENISFDIKVCSSVCAFMWLYSDEYKPRKLKDSYKMVYVNIQKENNDKNEDVKKKLQNEELIENKTEIIHESNKLVNETQNVQKSVNSSDSILTNVENMMINTRDYLENKYPRILVYFGLCIIILGIVLMGVGCSFRNCKETEPNFEKQLNEIDEHNSPSIYYHAKKNKYKLID